MARSRILRALAAASVLAAALAPAPASASTTQESIFQDDNQLVYASPSHAAQVLGQLASLGVQRVRISVIWALVAPNPLSSTRPSFDAANPADYPAGAWDRYDVLVTDAQALGLHVDFDVTAPAPYWATRRPPAYVNNKFRKVYSPSAVEFGQFVEAVGTRYSGSYITHTPPPPPPPPELLGVPLPTLPILTPPAPTPVVPIPLPRVDYWEIWNEPNEAGWLAPQWRPGPAAPAVHGHTPAKTWTELSPVTYRGLLDQAASALAATGHSEDTILVGDTSAKGSVDRGLLPAMPPMVFLRALYCVGGSYRPLTGTRAAQLDCPADGSTSTFAAEHPELVNATGYADHPYSFTRPPNVPSTDPTWATMADLPRLERALTRVFATYGNPRPSGVPLYLTEYGYKSNPPNPYVTVSQAQQAEYINQGEYLAWRQPYVRALAQFELIDAGPNAAEPIGSPAYWGTFQTGLMNAAGVPKPSYFAYRLPIWVAHPRTGPRVTVWGQLRPADHGGPESATIQLRAAGASTFTALQQVQTANPEGFILAHVSVSAPGSLRLAWADPASGQVYYSRIVSVR
jgi:hypothetical protein